MENIIVVYNDDCGIKRGTKEDVISLNAVVDASEDIEKALIESDFDVFRIGLNSNNLMDVIKRIETSKPCIVFNLCEAFDGDTSLEMNVAALFELLGVTYTGSTPAVIGLTADKRKTKQLLLHNNIPAPKEFYINNAVQGLQSEIRNFQFPLIVKPLSEDGSMGIDRDSVVFNPDTLKLKIKYIFEIYNQPAIVEEYVDGREFNVSIIGNSSPYILPVAEIDYSQVPHNNPKILCYKSKWMKGSDIYRLTPSICPADISGELEEKIKEAALKAFKVTGCRDYGRIDIRLKEDETPMVLEVNSNPDISIDAGMAKSAKKAGWSYSKMVENILNTAMKRDSEENLAHLVSSVL